MKNASKKFIAVMLALLVLSPLSASAAVNVYADDIQTNAASAISEAPAVINAPATNNGQDKKSTFDAAHSNVRIDETGVHVGGPNPVDITAPGVTIHNSSKRVAEWLVKLVAILSTFGMPVAIIFIVFFFKHRRNKMAHDTLRAMIDKGMPITPELVAQLRGRSSAWYGNGGSCGPRGRLMPALVLTGIGTALLISDHGHNTGGWIVLFIGVAFLVVWLVEGKSQNNTQPPRL